MRFVLKKFKISPIIGVCKMAPYKGGRGGCYLPKDPINLCIMIIVMIFSAVGCFDFHQPFRVCDILSFVSALSVQNKID